MEIYKALGTFVGQHEHCEDDLAYRIATRCFGDLLTLEGPHRVEEASKTFQVARRESAVANTPSALLHRYQDGHSVPGNTHRRAATLIDNIVDALSGKEWNADTVGVVADLLVAQGYEMKGVDEDE